MFTVILKSCGNPDFNQDPNKTLSPTERVKVSTLKQASEQCLKYIAQCDLGGGNWAGGQVRDSVTGTFVCKISYNGRAWGAGGSEIPLA